MDSSYFNWIGGLLRDLIIGMFVLGIIVGGALFWGLPALWHVLKPFLHRITS